MEGCYICYFSPGLTTNTTYRVSIRAKNIKASPYVDEKSLIRLLEKLSAHTEFRTLKKGLPDPPMDVRVDPGPQDGTVLVTWIPVTLNNQVTFSLTSRLVHSHWSSSYITALSLVESFPSDAGATSLMP